MSLGLDKLPDGTVTQRKGRTSIYSAQEWQEINAARQRNVAWPAIYDALPADRRHKSAQMLATSYASQKRKGAFGDAPQVPEVPAAPAAGVAPVAPKKKAA